MKLTYLILILLFSCSGKPQRDISSLERENGIYFRDKDLTFNKKNDFQLKDGIIYQRPSGKEKWNIIPGPLSSKNVVELGVDSDQMVAIDKNRRVYWNRNAFGRSFSRDNWIRQWGAPLGQGPGIKLPKDTLSWDYSYFSPKEDVYYTDETGNRHFIGVGVTTIYILRNQGQWITYLDPWLPADYSYEICGPVRGRFKAEKISSSGSVLFLINKYGDMYTRTYDFDIAGGDNLFFWYTYDTEEARARRTRRDSGLPPFYESLFNRRLISVTGWKIQPKINGSITDRISIIKVKEGGQARLLRVEGLDENGKSGYFQKPIFGGNWKFFATGQKIKGNKLKNSLESSSHLTLGKNESKMYTAMGPKFSLKVKNFHPYCSPAQVQVTFKNGTKLNLFLHTRERIRLNTRSRGISGKKLLLDGALEIPKDVLENLPTMSGNIRYFLSRYLKNKRFTNIQVEATNQNLRIFPNSEAKVKDIMSDAARDPLSNLNPLIHLERIRNLSTVEFNWKLWAR